MMAVQFNVSLSDMKRACRRLRAGARDDGGERFVALRAGKDAVEIVTPSALFDVSADVVQGGAATIPHAVLLGVAHTLPHFRKKRIEVWLASGQLRIEGTVFHNPGIALEKRQAAPLFD